MKFKLILMLPLFFSSIQILCSSEKLVTEASFYFNRMIDQNRDRDLYAEILTLVPSLKEDLSSWILVYNVPPIMMAVAGNLKTFKITAPKTKKVNYECRFTVNVCIEEKDPRKTEICRNFHKERKFPGICSETFRNFESVLN